MNFDVAFKTDIGRRRSQNQDSLAVAVDLGLFVVADGMGGHQGGETASRMVCEMLPELVRKAQGTQSDWDPRTVLIQTLETINHAVHARADENPKLHGMGTTTTALLFKDDTITIGHVGDSRCYFFRPNMIWQATRDHSLVQEKLRAGLITRDEVKTDQMRNVITRSVGFDAVVSVETYQMKVQPGDVFLICSDGLSGLIENEDMLRITQDRFYDNKDLNKAVESLVQAANENGGDDNITAVMVHVKN